MKTLTNFCTLFDHNYLSRGLVLYESLRENCTDDFALYILATDDIAFKWLSENQHKNIIVNSITDIKEHYPVLEKLEQERPRNEFNWTLSSFSIQFFLKKYNLASLTYLDADLCFYSDPQVLFNELNSESVIITPHNYTPCYDQTATSGRYCVQFVYFKNDASGNKVLEWWRNACEECCCSTPKDGKFGDQKYLDDWLTRFPGLVHEEKHMGCGIAPWNVQQFDIEIKDDKFLITDKITKIKNTMIFYHFHGVKEFLEKDNSFIWDLSSYELSNFVIENIYRPYTKKLEETSKALPEQNIREWAEQSQKPLTLPVLLFRTTKRSVKYFLKAFMFCRTMKQRKNEYDENKSKLNILKNQAPLENFNNFFAKR